MSRICSHFACHDRPFPPYSLTHSLTRSLTHSVSHSVSVVLHFFFDSRLACEAEKKEKKHCFCCCFFFLSFFLSFKLNACSIEIGPRNDGQREKKTVPRNEIENKTIIGKKEVAKRRYIFSFDAIYAWERERHGQFSLFLPPHQLTPVPPYHLLTLIFQSK